MTAIYKKELKSYLTSMIGYLFMAFTLALFGLYFTAINLQQGYPEIGYALQNSAFILLIAVPVLTMRVLSEEQKNKTDQLLLTAPVKISDIILGKYLALLTIYVIPVLIMCLYPLLLGTHGTVSYAVSYTSILGYFLLGAAYISVGVFVSSITESQVIAAVVGFVILFLCYVESGIANFFPEGAGSSFFAFFIIIALVWRWTGYNMVFYLSGLQNIEYSVYEAAKIDGASPMQSFFKITVPLLKPTILLTAITSTNGTLQLFDESLNLTNGGPGKSTMTMSHYIYNISFKQSPNFGYAAAMSILILIMVAILAILQMKVGDER